MKIFNKKLWTLILIASFLILHTSLFSQDIQVSMCKNTSSQKRLQNALGFGILYNHTVSKSWKMGLGIYRCQIKNHFYDIPDYWGKSDSDFPKVEIKSLYTITSLRFNIQKKFNINDYLSFSIGSVFSNNIVKGTDNEFMGIDTATNTQIVQSYYNHSNYIGVGFISEVEVKQIFLKQLSLCFTVESEALLCRDFRAMPEEFCVLPSSFGFTEFQVGLRYYLRSKKE